jgi:hypothetical protein
MAQARFKRGYEKLKKEYRFPHNNLFVIALLTLIAFLLVELVIRIYNLYKTVPVVDVPSHLSAGIALSIIFFWALSLTKSRRKRAMSIVFTFIAACIWEILETLEQMVIENPPWMIDYFFWDGFWDIIVTVAGGLIGLWILGMLKNKTSLLNNLEF